MKSKTTCNAMFAGLPLIIALIMVAPVANAQMADQAELREINSQNAVSVPAVVNPFSLLDLSKVQWSHSYSLSFGGNAFGSGSYGMFSTAMSYEFSRSLSMAFALGVGHNPGALFNKNLNSSSELYPAFSLDYHPNNKFRLNLTVAKMPYSQYRNGRYGSYSPYGFTSPGISRSALFGYPSLFDRR
ncbi:hypothetical protein JYT16_00585 [Gemmatimonas aurantiaca]|nr:hypothetical protein [Gemmatimonas aurantiaca]